MKKKLGLQRRRKSLCIIMLCMVERCVLYKEGKYGIKHEMGRKAPFSELRKRWSRGFFALYCILSSNEAHLSFCSGGKKGKSLLFSSLFGMYMYCMCRIEIALTFNVTYCIVSKFRIQISSFCGLKIDNFLFKTNNSLVRNVLRNCYYFRAHKECVKA